MEQPREHRTHGDLEDALRFEEHFLKQGEELFSLDMPRDDAERIDICPRAVDAETVGPEREYFAPCLLGFCLREAVRE